MRIVYRGTAMAIAAVALAAAAGGCSAHRRNTGRGEAPASPAMASSGSRPGTPASGRITQAAFNEDTDGARLVVSSDAPLLYTSYEPRPGLLVFDFPGVELAEGFATPAIASGLIQSVQVEPMTELGKTVTRLTISHRAGLTYQIGTIGEGLAVAFSVPGAAAPSAEPAAAVAAVVSEPIESGQGTLGSPASASPAAPRGELAHALEEVVAEPGPDGVAISLLGDGSFAPKDFVLANPPRIVVDLPGVQNQVRRRVIAVGSGLVSRVRISQFQTHPEMVTRVVVDLTRPVSHVVEADGERLSVRVGGAAVANARPAEPGPSRTMLADASVPASAIAYPIDSPGAEVSKPAVEVSAPPEEKKSAEPAPPPPDSKPAQETVAVSSGPAVAAPPVSEAAVSPQETSRSPEPAASSQGTLRSPEPPGAAAPAERDDAAAKAPPPAPKPVPVPPAAPEPARVEPAKPPAPTPAMETASRTRVAERPPPSAAARSAAAPTRSGGQKASPSRGDALFEAAAAMLAQEEAARPAGDAYQSRTIAETQSQFTGEPISLDLKDADIKDVFRTISELTGLNIVIDPEVRGTVTVKLDDVPWDQALDLILKQNGLGYVLENNVMRIATTTKLQAEQGDRARLSEARQAAEPTRTVIKKLSYARAAEITPTLKSVMSRRGDIVVDPRTNTLIIREIPTYLPAVLQLIENLDTSTPQVMIESRIVETTKTLGRSLGISWGFDAVADVAHGNTTNLIFPNNIAGNFNVDLPAGPTIGAIRLGNILDTFNLDIALTAAENQGLLKIISSPKVTALTNTPALIQSGVQIPVQTNVNNTTTVIYVDATLRLQVTPQITAEGTILLDVNVQKREPAVALNLALGQNVPLRIQEYRGQILVRDGGTTVIGGIFQINDQDQNNMIPGLWKIPILGNLFRNKTSTLRHDELLIFITPRIVR